MADEQQLTDKAIQSVAQLTRETAVPQLVDGSKVPFVIIPAGAKVESLEKIVFNDHLEAPERIRQSVTVRDPASFLEYFTKFSDEDSMVFADEPSMTVTGILDYHAPLSPSWCQHTVALCLRESEEWKVWTGKNNTSMTQMQFAEFLEQYSMDIVKPAPAHMMDVARDLEATTEVEFGAGSRTQDGQVRFKYLETTKATVGSGKLDVPQSFTINLPVFIGGPRISMDALLRYRVKDTKLVLWYTLVRPEEVKRSGFIASRDAIAEALDIKIINGNA